MSGQIKSLQVLRFVAATMVAVFHAQVTLRGPNAGEDWAGHFTALGAAGVDLFFVLSGAIIYRSAFEGALMPAVTFLRRRFLRIAPIYFLVSLAWWPLSGLCGYDLNWRNVASTFTFWPAWDYADLPIVPVGWTLCFEMLFYVSASLVLVSRWFLVALLAAFASAWYGAARLDWAPLHFLSDPIMAEFAFGVLIAWAWRLKTPAPLWFGSALIVAAAAWMVTFCLPLHFVGLGIGLRGDIALARVLAWGLPAALALIGALLIEPRLKGDWLKLPVFMGDASYSIYLVHWPLFAGIAAFAGFANVDLIRWPIQAALVVVALAAGALLYRFVEKSLTTAIANGASAWTMKRQTPSAAAP